MLDPALEFLQALQSLNQFLLEQGQPAFVDPALGENFLVGQEITGTEGNDTLTGTEGMDTIRGLGGDDLLLGRQLDDVLLGKVGNDSLRGGRGFDSLFGGRGDDWLYGERDDDLLNGNLGDDRLFGGLGADRFAISRGNDRIEDFNAAEGDKVLIFNVGPYDNVITYTQASIGVELRRFEILTDSEGRPLLDAKGFRQIGPEISQTTIVGTDVFVWDPTIEREPGDPAFDPTLQVLTVGNSLQT